MTIVTPQFNDDGTLKRITLDASTTDVLIICDSLRSLSGNKHRHAADRLAAKRLHETIFKSLRGGEA